MSEISRHPLVVAVRTGLADAAEPCRAPSMQKYMRSAMPFRGVQMPVARRMYRAAIKAHPLAGRAEWDAVVRELYDHAEYREERYAALEVLKAPRYAPWLDRDALPLLRHVVSTGAWWDLVDDASTAVGAALLRDPDGVRPELQRWAHGSDMWLHRASIICQRKAKAATDLALLTETIEAGLGHADFFIRKAIGWALREHSKTDEAWVRAFVDAHDDLSALSRRQAPKWLNSSTQTRRAIGPGPGAGS